MNNENIDKFLEKIKDYKADRLALLIDSDNAQASIISELLEEVSKFGIATIKRAYGDWTTNRLKNWKENLITYAIQPIQQFSYTTGKNSTDSALIIDAMDILHSNVVDGFCIVSSDSDFTRLATRIRESGLKVYGFGEKKTPSAFIGACDKFIFTENLQGLRDNKLTRNEQNELKDIIIKAIEAVSNENGWADLATVSQFIQKNYPSFDTRNYGFKKYGELMKSLSYLECDNKNTSFYVKIKG